MYVLTLAEIYTEIVSMLLSLVAAELSVIRLHY